MNLRRMDINYTPLVEISDIEDFRTEEEKRGEVSLYGDSRNGKLYCYSPESKLAVNVALATGRPLLVIGPTGCGKSALAFNLSRKMKRKYYEFVVSSRSQARDLFYRYDAVRRLGDAQARIDEKDSEKPIWKTQYPYIEPVSGGFTMVIVLQNVDMMDRAICPFQKRKTRLENTRVVARFQVQSC